MRNGKRGVLRTVLSVLLTLLILAVGAGTVLYYITGPAEGYMTSDTTDSLRWAYAELESGKVITPDFAYAAILPFGVNSFFLPFLRVYGYSMAAQIGGLCAFAVVLTGALFYLATGLGLNRYQSAGLVTLTLLLLSSSAKLREIMWEHIFYYNLGILFFCIGFGLVARILRRHPRGFAQTALMWVRMLFLTVFCGLAALDGLQALVCLTLPLLGGILLERFSDGNNRLLSRRNGTAWMTFLLVGIGSAVGFLLIKKVTGGVTSGYADAYSSYSAMSKWTNNFLGFFGNWFSLFGISVEAGDPLASVASVLTVLRIFTALLLLIVPFILLFSYRKIESIGIRMALIGHFAVSAFILFAVTFGKLGGANWRLTPMLGTSVILTVTAAFEFLRRKKAFARLGALLLTVLILTAGIQLDTIRKMPRDYGANNSWHVAAAELERRGLQYGYANFWWAEAVTMFSDGKVQVANLAANTSQPKKYVYQLPRDSFDDKEDASLYFLLLTEKEQENMSDWIGVQLISGNIVESFTLQSEPYDLRGYSGSELYIYVFNRNLF